MKKIFLIMLLVLGISGCGNKEQNSNEKTNQAQNDGVFSYDCSKEIEQGSNGVETDCFITNNTDKYISDMPIDMRFTKNGEKTKYGMIYLANIAPKNTIHVQPQVVNDFESKEDQEDIIQNANGVVMTFANVNEMPFGYETYGIDANKKENDYLTEKPLGKKEFENLTLAPGLDITATDFEVYEESKNTKALNATFTIKNTTEDSVLSISISNLRLASYDENGNLLGILTVKKPENDPKFDSIKLELQPNESHTFTTKCKDVLLNSNVYEGKEFVPAVNYVTSENRFKN